MLWIQYDMGDLDRPLRTITKKETKNRKKGYEGFQIAKQNSQWQQVTAFTRNDSGINEPTGDHRSFGP